MVTPITMGQNITVCNRAPEALLDGEDWILNCLSLLHQKVNPNKQLADGYSLVQKSFKYLGERAFDRDLRTFLLLVETLATKGADFGLRVTEIEHGIPCIDFSCGQIAYIYWKQLAKENNQNAPLAWQCFEKVGQDMDIYDCLQIGYLTKVCEILRSGQVNPNLMADRYTPSPWENFFQSLVWGFFDNEMVNEMGSVPKTIKTFLEFHADPNFRFEKIEIKNKGIYHNATCLHLAFLYWRVLKTEKKTKEAQWMKQAFHHILADPRADVRARFSEYELIDMPTGHFSMYMQGDHLEDATLAHIALAEGNWKTSRKVLSMAHDLVGSTCMAVRGKDLYATMLSQVRCGYEVRILYPQRVVLTEQQPLKHVIGALKQSPSVGTLAVIDWGEDRGEQFIWWMKDNNEIARRRDVSLCHLAARILDLEACSALTAVGANGNFTDSECRTPHNYAQMFMSEAFTAEHSKTIRKIGKALKKGQLLPPTLPAAFYIYRREGYDVIHFPTFKFSMVRHLLYDGVPIQKIDAKTHTGYRQDPLIPPLNRAKVTDYKVDGLVLGHQKPRADARDTEVNLYDVGYLTNIIPQDGILNNGLWKSLENEIRQLAKVHLCIHVYTGGVFTTDTDIKGPKQFTHRVVGANEVHVPTHLFKVIYMFDYPYGWRSLAILVRNSPTGTKQHVTVQRIQELTGVDFLGFYNA